MSDPAQDLEIVKNRRKRLMETFMPYSLQSVCPKCRYNVNDMLYKRQYVIEERAIALVDWLQCTCSRCGYEFSIKCADVEE